MPVPSVPVPSVTVPSVTEPMLDGWLAELNTKKLFKFSVNADGKAQNVASKKAYIT